jgi:hypothetical protein
MKTYFEYIDDLTDDDIFDSLVGFGLFAEKIPSFLSSEDFLKYIKSVQFPVSKTAKDYIRYSSIRNINIPRPMAIPEPFAYINHCKSLKDNWDKIQKHFEDTTLNQDYKISRIHLRKLKDKPHIFEMNYKNFTLDGEPEQDIVIRSNYVACADISNCFPSIYSHSISWALVGKANAKSRQLIQTEWFNQLDFYSRNLKYGETNGLLIGPHSSNLISEIILSKIDFELTAKGFKYIRNIDDYTCFVNSYELADKFFLELSELLKHYELSLNNKKSKIIPLPKGSVEDWLTRINHFNFTNTFITFSGQIGIRVKELKGFLDFTITLMLEKDSDAAILNYAIKVLSNKYLGNKAIEYYIKQIHHLVLLYPYLIHLLEIYVFDAHNISKDVIKRIAEDVYNVGLRKRLYEPCAYAVYWAMKYGFTLSINLKNDSITSNDCIFLLISYLYDKKHNNIRYLKEYKDLANLLKVDDFDRYWLFIYEVLSMTDLINANYKPLKRAKITFVKEEFRS